MHSRDHELAQHLPKDTESTLVEDDRILLFLDEDRTMNKLTSFATVTVALAIIGLAVQDAHGQSTVQRRLHPGTYSLRSGRTWYRSFSYAPAPAPAQSQQTYRSFSYEPAPASQPTTNACPPAVTQPADQTNRSFSFDPGVADEQAVAAPPQGMYVAPLPRSRSSRAMSGPGARIYRRLHPGVR